MVVKGGGKVNEGGKDSKDLKDLKDSKDSKDRKSELVLGPWSP